MTTLIRFNNDYNHGAHPAILEALERANADGFPGYGLDGWCDLASQAIRAHLGDVDADVHFMIGGTQVNYTVIAAALRPYQGVISADSGHINCHETGAVENTGHKILTVPACEGKLTVEGVEAWAESFRESGIQEHITCPKLVFLSFPSEFGTIYTLDELRAIREVCDRFGMYLYIDGARMAYGLEARGCDVTLADIASLADAFYIGGTKCGALFGEAVVLVNPELKVDFRAYMKQNGGMLAKGWLLGLQFATLFEDDLYLSLADEAVGQAMAIRDAFMARGIELFIDSPTNQQFVVLDGAQIAELERTFVFEHELTLDDNRECVRFCTSWSTTDKDVRTLVQAIEAL